MSSIWTKSTVKNAPGRVAQVNAALKARGVDERLIRGRGYFYFWKGETSSWPSSSVYINDADLLTVEEWLAEYDQLKKEGVR